jgi:hypothetical protein
MVLLTCLFIGEETGLERVGNLLEDTELGL